MLPLETLQDSFDFYGLLSASLSVLGTRCHIVPDLELGKKMVKRIRKEVEGSSPQLLCAKPEVVRELPLDLRTGDVAR